MKASLIIFYSLVFNISCNSISTNRVTEINKASYFNDNFNPISLLSGFSNILNPLIEKIVNSEKSYPPVKLVSPSKVRAPLAIEVKRHYYHALAAYCTFDKLLFFRCERGCYDYKIVKTFNNHIIGTKATIGVEQSTKEIIISYRGSQNLQNWIMDLNFNKVNLPNSPEGVLVHKGFLDMYQSLSLEINTYLMNMLNSGEYKGYKVIITGQSLGGALATIHAVDIASKIKNKGYEVLLYTYHSPRVGNQEFVNYAVSLDFPTARYTNRADIVNHLCPRSLGYVHIPVEFHTDFKDIASNSFHECSQDYDEDPNCGWKEINNISAKSIFDHGIGFGSYIIRFC